MTTAHPKIDASAVSSASTGKLHQMLGDLRKLPLLPATAQQALALANDESASLQDFSRLLEQDITLTSTILKMANSPFFNRGRTVAHLHQAVVHLGVRQCQNLIVAASMHNLFHKADAVTTTRCAVLWQHCFLTACFCRRLNQELRLGYQGEEFAAGLLHDLGRILLAVTMPDEFSSWDALDFIEDDQTLAREQRLLGTDHCQVGSEYAVQNNLPPTAVIAIRFHHRLEEADDHRVLLNLVAAADHLANYVKQQDSSDTYDIKQSPGFALLTRDWPAEKAQSLQQFLPKLIAETASDAQNARRRNSSGQIARPAVPASAPAKKETLLDGVRSWLSW